MKRYWKGIASLADLALLIRHIAQWTVTKGAALRGAEALHQWAVGLIGESSSTVETVEHLRHSIPELATSYIDRCQSGNIDEASFEEDWHLSQFFKKFRFDCTQTTEEAEEAFKRRNLSTAMKASAFRQKSNGPIVSRMRELLNRALPFVEEVDGRFGPGATLDAGTTWAEKVRWVAANQKWHRIWERWPRHGGAVCKLHVVPKDFAKNRTITIETLQNQWLQQAARSTILKSIHKGSLRRTVMDLGQVPTVELESGLLYHAQGLKDPVQMQRNRCIEGALTGHLVTLDLSDASDTIPWEAVQAVFPAWYLQLVEPCRSETYVDRYDLSGAMLSMYAGMGNATTFVTETLYFWALLTAVGEEVHCGKPQVTVFGDDIVMNGKVARNAWFQSKLSELGLKLNVSKSGLSAGPGFREACGIVAFRDHALDFTYRFYGYAATREGAIGYCDITSRLLDSTNPVLNALGICLLDYPNRPIAPLVTLEGDYESSLCYRIPQDASSIATVCRIYPRKAVVRWNKRLQRIELRLPTVEAYTSRITIKDPVWGPGVIRSWGYWAYKLSLQGCTPVQGCKILPKAREVSYAIPHRTKVRNRWIPGRFTTFSVL